MHAIAGVRGRSSFHSIFFVATLFEAGGAGGEGRGNAGTDVGAVTRSFSESCESNWHERDRIREKRLEPDADFLPNGDTAEAVAALVGDASTGELLAL